MEQSGGRIAAKLAMAPDGGEDRLSALPDDVLVLILECLDTTAEAARTSVLARRWRSLWPLHTKLRFHLHPDGNRIRDLLDAAPDTPGGPPELSCISVTTQGAGAHPASTWLPAAARRLAGGLVYRSMARDRYSDHYYLSEKVKLPCFEKATSIELDLSFGSLALPSLGVFTRLTNLSLRSLEYTGTCELGNVLSMPRCPRLQKLSICYFSGVGNLSIHSESLLQMELKGCDLSEMTIETPNLEKLSVHDSFPFMAEADLDGDDLSGPVAKITAPKMLYLEWIDLFDPRYVQLGNMEQLRELQIKDFWVHGTQFHRGQNRHCLMLLQRFQVLHTLHLPLFYVKDISNYQYLLGDITMLPQITFLKLRLWKYGHAFGASLFHLLKMCIGLRKLLLIFDYDNLEEELACPSDCICDQPENWKTDELVLGHLEDVCITRLQGDEHEVAFVQRLLGWATVLRSLRITLDNKLTEGKIMEFCEALAGFSRPETCVQFDTSDNK